MITKTVSRAYLVVVSPTPEDAGYFGRGTVAAAVVHGAPELVHADYRHEDENEEREEDHIEELWKDRYQNVRLQLHSYRNIVIRDSYLV